MARFIFAGMLLFILCGVTVCPPPKDDLTEDERKEAIRKERMAMMNAKVTEVCTGEAFKNFIECELKPGVSKKQGVPFDPQSIHTDFGKHSGLIFVKATPTPLDVNPSELRTIWKYTGEAGGGKNPVHTPTRVALKFPYEESDQSKNRLKTEKNRLQRLYAHGLAAARYGFENGDEKQIMADFMIMEPIDGVTLQKYIELAKLEHSSMRGLEGYDKDTKDRLPGLRMLYTYTDVMLFLEKLIEKKWRHCSFDPESLMVRSSTEKEIQELKKQLKENEEKNDYSDPAYRDAWIALQFEARSFVNEKDKAYYHTDNKHMVFIDAEKATPVAPKQEKKRGYHVCHGPSDIWSIFKHLKEWTIKDNEHFARVQQAIKEISSSVHKRIPAIEEEETVKGVIKKLRDIEKDEKKHFIEHLEATGGGRSPQSGPPQQQETTTTHDEHERYQEQEEKDLIAHKEDARRKKSRRRTQSAPPQGQKVEPTQQLETAEKSGQPQTAHGVTREHEVPKQPMPHYAAALKSGLPRPAVGPQWPPLQHKTAEVSGKAQTTPGVTRKQKALQQPTQPYASAVIYGHHALGLTPELWPALHQHGTAEESETAEKKATLQFATAVKSGKAREQKVPEQQLETAEISGKAPTTPGVTRKQKALQWQPKPQLEAAKKSGQAQTVPAATGEYKASQRQPKQQLETAEKSGQAQTAPAAAGEHKAPQSQPVLPYVSAVKYGHALGIPKEQEVAEQQQPKQKGKVRLVEYRRARSQERKETPVWFPQRARSVAVATKALPAKTR